MPLGIRWIGYLLDLLEFMKVVMSKDKLSVWFLAVISVISLMDVSQDLAHGETLDGVLVEGIIIFIALFGVLLIVRENILVRKQNLELQINLEASKADLIVWKEDSRKLIAGLGEAIDKQMSRWELTPAEKEVGFLLLKGFSFKEIAGYRDTTERTARQQSLEIYKKSALAGRAEFSGFFLEDLLLPISKTEKKNNASKSLLLNF